jgi:hypothetical protein
MTPKEVKKALADNPGHSIYTRTPSSHFIQFHAPASKTRVTRYARYFKGFRCGTYLEERPDLDPKRICHGNQKIITFYM